MIGVIFDNECSFKTEVLTLNGWESTSYTIDRCHAALRYRLTLKHDDGREKDVYIDSNEVYGWIDSLGILGE